MKKLQEEIPSFQSVEELYFHSLGEKWLTMVLASSISSVYSLAAFISMWQRDYDDSNYSGKITYSSINQKTWSKHNFNFLWDSYFMIYVKLCLWLYVFSYLYSGAIMCDLHYMDFEELYFTFEWTSVLIIYSIGKHYNRFWVATHYISLLVHTFYVFGAIF